MSFPLAGNSRIRSAVEEAVRGGTLPHAMIIEGEKGTGRHTLAQYIAAAAVCTGEETPCGECRGCRLQKAGTHPDITVTAPEDGKKNIAVSQIRALRNEAYVKPHMADCRVFIIDRADTMNEQSQNALLKVLEEPPGAAVFILIAESKASLLETVISRCAVLSLSVPEYKEALEYIKSRYDYSENTAAEALGEAACNIGAALDILAGRGSGKTAEAAKEFVQQFLKGDAFEMLKITAGFEKDRVSAGMFFKELKYYTSEAAKKSRSAVTAARLVSFYSQLSEYERSLDTNINLSLLFSALVCAAEA